MLIRWLWLPDRGALGTLVPMGPERWGPDSEEWVFHLNYENADTASLDDAHVIATMKETLGLPDLDNFAEYSSDLDVITDAEAWKVAASMPAHGLAAWAPPVPASFLAPPDGVALARGEG